MLSGADIEGIVGASVAASRSSPAANVVTPEALAEVIAQFLPSTQGLEKELQEIGGDHRVYRSRVPAAGDRGEVESGRWAWSAAAAPDGAQGDGRRDSR